MWSRPSSDGSPHIRPGTVHVSTDTFPEGTALNRPVNTRYRRSVVKLQLAVKKSMNCACKLSVGNQIVGLPDALKPRFLSGLPKAALDSVLSVAKHRHFRACSVVIGEEDPAERLFLLTSGHGRHFVITSDGRKILLHWLTAGQIFGGAALLSIPSQYLANTEVLSDSCALAWERQTIRELATKFPALLDNTLSIAVTENIAWSTAAHVSLTSDDAHGRVAHLLVSLASAIGEATRDGVEMRVMNEDLAEGANVTPFTVSPCLRDWERAGILVDRNG
jgi:CRP/FNR family transcriptional regulator, nitrogen oxide reductase regulator